MKQEQRIYLDHAAATPLDPRVFSAMREVRGVFANPNSQYSEGRQARNAYEAAKKRLATTLNVRASEIVITSGATESDNLAILGSVRPNLAQGAHVVSLATEHKSVLMPLEQLRREGAKVDFAAVDAAGVVDLARLEKSIGESTVLVSISYASSEFGTIQPMAKIKSIIDRVKKKRVEQGSLTPLLLHSDCSAVAGLLPLSPARLGLDFMTLNPAKFYGPHGVGILFVKAGTVLSPIMYGGGQQYGLRPGSEDVASVVGAACALELVESERELESRRLSALRDEIIRGLEAIQPNMQLNGHSTKRLANNIHISLQGVNGEDLVAKFDAHGIAVSTGAACAAADEEPSHALLALGLSRELAQGSVRITLGKLTTQQKVQKFLQVAERILG